ncbi:MAG: hypothetical protein H6564_20925 [Lewinellaceae bacterium]|nr:hypothetical protein [Lewinellaceae bacterium]
MNSETATARSNPRRLRRVSQRYRAALGQLAAVQDGDIAVPGIEEAEKARQPEAELAGGSTVMGLALSICRRASHRRCR